MTTIVVFLTCAALVVAVTAVIEVLQLSKPEHGAVYYIVSGGLATIPVSYHVADKDMASVPTAFCLEVVSLGNRQTYSENCFAPTHKSLNLNEVGPGNYRLTAYLRRVQPPDHPVMESSIQTIEFEVRTASPPTVDIVSVGQTTAEHLVAITNPASDLSAVRLTLQWHGLAELFSSFEACVSLKDTSSPSTVVLPQSCFPPTEQSITLNKIPVGRYKLQLVLRTSANVILNESLRSYRLSIVPLVEAYPTLSIMESSSAVTQGRHSLEYAVDSATGYAKADVEIAVGTAVPGAAELVVACMELLAADGVQTLAENTCLAPSQRVFRIAQLPAGAYTAVFALLPAFKDGATDVPHQYAAAVANSRVVAHIEVRRPEELVPSYDWQPLKPWHTVPAGLEVRLPIGSGAVAGEVTSRTVPRKEARIPEPWRLQVELPRPPCRPYFLRMDVTRRTTIAQIRAEAALQCNVPEGCISILGSGRELSPEDTMEAVQFFSVEKLVRYDSTCAAVS